MATRSTQWAPTTTRSAININALPAVQLMVRQEAKEDQAIPLWLPRIHIAMFTNHEWMVPICDFVKVDLGNLDNP